MNWLSENWIWVFAPWQLSLYTCSGMKASAVVKILTIPRPNPLMSYLQPHRNAPPTCIAIRKSIC